jgi:hypothetical protein
MNCDIEEFRFPVLLELFENFLKQFFIAFVVCVSVCLLNLVQHTTP